MKHPVSALGIFAATFCLAVPHHARAQEIPAQTQLVVRTVDAIDSRNADLAKEYNAGLDNPVTIDGTAVLPRGTDVVLRVAEVQQAGAVRGRASLTLKLVALVVNDQRVPVESGEVTSESGSQGAKATKGGILGGLAGGALGGVLGGAGGAVKGATAGAAVGVGVAALSGERVQVPAETRLTFTLAKAVSLRPQSAPPAAVSAASGSTAAPGILQSQVRFDMVGAAAQGRTLTVSLQALNEGADRPVAISREAVQIVDDAGNVYRATRVVIGNQDERSELITGIRTNISLVFDGLPAAGTSIQANAVARLRAKVRLGPQVQAGPETGEDLEFRNLAIRKN
jgi:hypothetical protein